MGVRYDNTNQGYLMRNKEKPTDKHPDFSGRLDVDGAQFFLSGWTSETKDGRKYLRVKIRGVNGDDNGRRY